MAVPSYSEQIPLAVMSRLNSLACPRGYRINFAHTQRVLIEKARNGIGHMFLQNDDEYLFFVDSDQLPSRNVLEEFIKLDKDIVTCPIPSRRGEEWLAVFDDNGARLAEFKGEREVWAAGMATTLIKREVVEKLFAKWRNPFSFEVIERDGVLVEHGEDVMFCRRAKELGYETWCTDKVYSEHIGEPVRYWYEGGEYKNSFDN